MILLEFLLIGIFGGTWGFLWNNLIGNKLPKTWSINIRKPLGYCLICTTTWWAMLVWFPLYIILQGYTLKWLFLAPPVASTGIAIAKLIELLIVAIEVNEAKKRDMEFNTLSKLRNETTTATMPLKPIN